MMDPILSMIGICRKNGRTMVLVTHDRDIAKYADRVLTIIDGRIVSDIMNGHAEAVEAAAGETADQAQ